MAGTESSNLSRIDSYIEELFSQHDEAQDHALRESHANELPQINVSPNEGHLIHLLARICGAKKILEIGTLGGYSTIWLARALPEGGHLLTLEFSPKHAGIAGTNIARAGLSDKVEVRVGAALDSLPQIEANGEGPFDLIFIDADKDNYPGYLEWAIKLSRPGTVILSDNLIRGGSVIEPEPGNQVASIIHDFNKQLASNPRLDSVILPIVRENVDGLGISIVRE